MKSVKFLLIALLAIFFVSTVSATVAVSGGFNGNLNTQSETITQGQNATFIAVFTSINPPITSSVNLPSGVSLVSRLCSSPSSYTFYCNYTVTSQNTGTYTIYIAGSDNSGSSDYAILSLTVNPSTPLNQPPVITQIPSQIINENTSYSYPVSASDPDGDTLTYFLVQAPSWLSINPSTGLISGNSPSVNSDTNYAVKVGVSDGITPDATMSYILTVKNTVQPPVTDKLPPVITLNYPANNTITNKSAIDFIGLVYDNVAVENVSLLLDGSKVATDYSGKNNTNYSFANILNDGVYNWSYQACDSSGNCVLSPVRVITVDTIPPQINVGSSTSSGNLSQNFIYVNVTASDNLSGVKFLNATLYDSSGIVKVSSTLSPLLVFNVTNLNDGKYYLNITAEDNAGNSNSTETRKITLDRTTPAAGFVYPTPSTNSILNQSYIPVNVTASDSGTGLKNITIYLYKSGSLLESLSSSTSPYFVNITGLGNGKYYLNATAYDNLGNLRKISGREITLDLSYGNQSNKGQNQNASPYNYTDPYTQQYIAQLNQTNKGITLGSQPQTSSKNTFWVWLLIVLILSLLILFVLIMLGRRQREEIPEKDISSENANTKPLY